MEKRRRGASANRPQKRGKPFWAPVAGKPKANDETATIPYEVWGGEFSDARGPTRLGRPTGDVGRREQAANRLLRGDAKSRGLSPGAYHGSEGIYIDAMEGEESWRKTEVPIQGVSPADVYEGSRSQSGEQGRVGGGAERSDADLSSSDAFDSLLFGQTVERPAKVSLRASAADACDCDVCALYRHTQSVGRVAAELAPRGRRFTQSDVLKTLRDHGTVHHDGKTNSWRSRKYPGSASKHTRIVSVGGDMERQGAYLRRVGLLPGLSPQEYWNRHFGRLTSRQRSLIRARERTWGWPESDLTNRSSSTVRERARSVGASQPHETKTSRSHRRAGYQWIYSVPQNSVTKGQHFDRLAQYLGKYRPYDLLQPGEGTALPIGATAPDGPLGTTWVFMEHVPGARELTTLGVAADELGLSDVAAARRLGLTQPALSKARKELRTKPDAQRRVRQAIEGPESGESG